MQRPYLAYSIQLAEFLIRKGYNIISVAPNKNDKSKYVFFLNNEDGQIENAVQEYKNNLSA